MLVKPTRNRAPVFQRVEGKVTQADREWLFESVNQVHRAVQAGVALPASEGSWHCSSQMVRLLESVQRKEDMNNSRNSFKTSKGTELPLLNLKGRDYLEVKYRLVWFREEHPNWSIETSFIAVGDRSACARAEIKDESGRVIATSHKSESAANFSDFMEKAETGAIGRALALIGYGTQFCADELDEGERVVDSPVSKKADYQRKVPEVTRAVGQTQPPGQSPDLGEFTITFGKKYLGKKLKDISQEEIESYLEWLEDNAARKNVGVTYEVTVLKNAVDRFYHPERFAAGLTTAHPSEVSEEGESAEEAS